MRGGAEQETDAEGDEAPEKKGLPEKKRKKLLNADGWERDCRLVDAANKLRVVMGEDVFEDFNVFQGQAEETIYSQGVRLSAAERKIILRAMSRCSKQRQPPELLPVGLVLELEIEFHRQL